MTRKKKHAAREVPDRLPRSSVGLRLPNWALVIVALLVLLIPSCLRHPPDHHLRRQRMREQSAESDLAAGASSPAAADPLFLEIDIDQDEELTFAEIDLATEVIRKMDRNADGVITKQEWQRLKDIRGAQ